MLLVRYLALAGQTSKCSVQEREAALGAVVVPWLSLGQQCCISLQGWSMAQGCLCALHLPGEGVAADSPGGWWSTEPAVGAQCAQ